MDLSRVRHMKPADIFWYWIKERHAIYISREAGNSKPWTDDAILQRFKFTNVFRRLDRVTQHYEQWILNLVEQNRFADVLFNTALYRLFNLPETMDAIGYIVSPGGFDSAKLVCQQRTIDKKKLFTSAYMITNAASHDPKYVLVLNSMRRWFDERFSLREQIMRNNSMEFTTKLLSRLPMIGPFIAYEIACDLAYSPMLDEASDIDTWANPGPGATRGLNRIHLRDVRTKIPRAQLIDEMRELFQKRHTRLDRCPHPLALKMREIEHSLCEFDKYMRVLNGEGYPKANYPGV